MLHLQRWTQHIMHPLATYTNAAPSCHAAQMEGNCGLRRPSHLREVESAQGGRVGSRETLLSTCTPAMSHACPVHGQSMTWLQHINFSIPLEIYLVYGPIVLHVACDNLSMPLPLTFSILWHRKVALKEPCPTTMQPCVRPNFSFQICERSQEDPCT